MSWGEGITSCCWIHLLGLSTAQCEISQRLKQSTNENVGSVSSLLGSVFADEGGEEVFAMITCGSLHIVRFSFIIIRAVFIQGGDVKTIGNLGVSSFFPQTRIVVVVREIGVFWSYRLPKIRFIYLLPFNGCFLRG